MPKLSASKQLLARALAYPGAHEDHPWGHTVAKVNGKIFAYVDGEKGGFYGGFKLPASQGAALMLPFVEPMAYGMGQHGWVSVSFEKGEPVPVGLMLEWLDESYRAVAPKKLVKELDQPAEPPAPKKKTATAKRKSR